MDKNLFKARKLFKKVVKRMNKTQLTEDQKKKFKDAADPLTEFLEELAEYFGDPPALAGEHPKPTQLPYTPGNPSSGGGSTGGSAVNSSGPGF